MLAIRMQRTGRKGHANFRVIVQDSHRSPTSGKVVAFLGSYDPHTKAATIVKDKADFYLQHGAQPSNRVALLLQKEGVKLPKWVEIDTKKQGKLRHEEKLRKNQAETPAQGEIKSQTEQTTDSELENKADSAQSSTSADADSAAASENQEAIVAEVVAEETGQTEELAAPAEEPAAETPAEEVEQAEISEEETPVAEEQTDPKESADSEDKTA